MGLLWSQLSHLFDTNDGSLPDIELNNLSGEEVENIYLYLRQNSEIVSVGSYFWSIPEEKEVPVDTVENAASLVTKGEAQCFHIVIAGLLFEGATIPDLGVFVSQNSIVLDYRMGECWGSAELEALFMCFSRIREIAPFVEIKYPKTPIYPECQEQFNSALLEYWNTQTTQL
jgi:hypothetical protein